MLYYIRVILILQLLAYFNVAQDHIQVTFCMIICITAFSIFCFPVEVETKKRKPKRLVNLVFKYYLSIQVGVERNWL